MLQVYRVSLTVALFLSAIAQGETPTLDAVRTSMDKSWKDVQSLHSDVTMDFLFPVGEQALPLSGIGTFDYLREDGKDKSRQLLTAKIPEPFPMEMKVDILFDGKKVHTIMEMMGQKQSHTGEPSLEQGALPPGGTRLLDALEKHLNLSTLPSETLENHGVYVLEGTPKDGTAPFTKIRFYIDEKMAVQRKTEFYQPDGTVGIKVLFSNIEQNTKPDPSLFAPAK